MSGDASIGGSIAVAGSAEINGSIGSNGLTVTGLVAPPAPIVATVGTAGSTTYSYAISAFNTANQSPLSRATTITTGNAALGGSNYNTITWQAVAGATGYNIYRTYTSSGAIYSSNIYIGTVYSGSTLTYNDQSTAPAAPTVAPQGTTGSTTYTYAISALYANGQQSPLSPSTTTATGNTVLNGTNYNKITWSAVSGAVNYNIYRLAAGGVSPVAVGLIGNSGGTLQFLDQAAATVAVVSPTNTAPTFQVQTASGANVIAANISTGQVSIDDNLTSMSTPTALVSTGWGGTGGNLGSGTYYYKVTAIDSAGGETLPSNEVSWQLTTGTTDVINLTWNAVAGATAYKVYRGTASNAENIYYVANSAINCFNTGNYCGDVIYWTDTGAAPSGGSVGNPIYPPTTSNAVLSGNVNPNPTYVTKWLTSGTNTTTTTNTIADSPVSVGDVLVLTTDTTTSGSHVSSISGGGANWSFISTDPVIGSTKLVQMWMGTVTTPGSGTITLTYSSSPGVYEINVAEFTASGVNSSTKWTADAFNGNETSLSQTTVAYPSLITQGNNEMYVGYGQSNGAGSAGSTPRLQLYSNFWLQYRYL